MTIQNNFLDQEEGGALMLAAAILERAKEDYINAIVADDKERAVALERFFMGKWGQELSLCQGDIIVEWCQRIAAEKIERRRRKRNKTSRKK